MLRTRARPRPRFRAAVVALLMLTGIPTLDALAEQSPPAGPLPRTVLPLRYRLALTIVPQAERFAGEVEIAVELSEPAARIWLHGKNLQVMRAYAVSAEGKSISAQYQQMTPEGAAVLQLAEELPRGRHTLVMSYDAPFNDDIGGMFKVEESGRPYVFTQLEPTQAREVFPGFDEPALKAPFEVSVTARNEDVVVTNTPQLRAEPLKDGLTRHTFAVSRPLPTYLVSFAVGALDVVEWQPIPASRTRARPVPLRGIAAKGKGAQLKYALDNTAPLLLSLEEYFASPYPYEKLDVIAAPIYAGAMENAASILYGEQYMLLRDDASPDQRQSYAYTHAHELAHQWIGNVVTPAWWDDLWLKESFATLMGNRAAGAGRPQSSSDRAILRMALHAMEADSRASTRAIRQPVSTVAEIGNAYGPITYEKGNAVLAMLEGFVGEDAFRRSIQLHLRRFMDGSATATDYLASLTQVTDSSRAAHAFESFLGQPGVPLLSVRWQCRSGSLEAELQQTRYAPLGSRVATDRRWDLPVCLAFDELGQRRTHCSLVSKQRETLVVPVTTCPTTVMPNARGSGYYRVSLPQAERDALLRDFGKLDAREALAFAHSLAAELHAGRLTVREYLVAAQRIAVHPSSDVAVAPIPTLTFVMRHLVTADHKASAAQFMRDLYRAHSANSLMSPSSDAGETALLHGQLVPFLALELHDEALRSGLRELAVAYIGFGQKDGSRHDVALAASLVPTALAVAAQDLGKPFLNHLWRALTESTDFIFRRDAASALAHVTDPALSAWVRGLLLTPQLRDNEALELFIAQAAVPENLAGSWSWSKAHLRQLAERVPGFRRGKLPSIAAQFCDRARLDEAQAVLSPLVRELDLESRTLTDAVEQIEHCMAMVARHAGDAAQLFAAHGVTTSRAAAQALADFDAPGQPGCAVGIYRNGDLAHAAGHGLADIERRVPITPDTVFDIASVSKQMTAFAIFLLESRGRLSLDDSVRKYVPELGAFADPVTIRQLIHHTAGLRDYAAILSMQDRKPEHPVTEEEIRRIIFRQRAPNHAPGRMFEYSNTGYALLALIVERVSKQNFATFMHARIFEPLGMRHTSIPANRPPSIANLARGYAPAEQGYVLDESSWQGIGSGQVHTTIRDLQLWDENLSSGAIGGAHVLRRMVEVGTLESGQRMTYAGGLVIGRHRGLSTAGHNGSWAGYRSELLRFPEQRFSVALLCNRADADAGPRVKAISEAHLGSLLQPEALPDFARELKSVAGIVEPARMPQGYYRDIDRGRYVRFWIENGAPKMTTAGVEFKLTQQEAGVFASESLRGLYLVFVGPDAGTPARIVLSNLGDALVALEFLEQRPARELHRYAGRYRSEEAGVEYEVVLSGGSLLLKTATAQLELQAGSGEEFFAPREGVAIRFEPTRAQTQRFFLSMFQLRNVEFERTR